ncbi:HNH endonuclease signature motif containing protein [Azospirillum tabaci]|uniref:HNH endonuclease signature motif containing protein n=1 Tax=Azospirillum tabaci TaxID=2752310 RepID=UPI001B3BB250|nr:HNH endonuclease signature motif containing protein [Azospirillum tabaci]
MFDENELSSYAEYLAEPWPKPEKGGRPAIPKIFRDDVKDESHYACAICGYMDNGEVAHIDAVANTLNNSPSNLIYLCPNHHTKYDYGFRVSSNVTENEVKAAKLLKRNARCRILKYEAFATKSIISLVKFLESLEKKAKNAETENMKTIHVSELNNLMSAIPDLLKTSQEQARKDRANSNIDNAIKSIAPNLSKIAGEKVGASNRYPSNEKDIREKAIRIVSEVNDALIEIDEASCPHCNGQGLTGLVGDFCRYCRGSCVVSQAKYDAYDPDDLDEVACPHCNGVGTTGLAGDFCRYCRGSCVVTQAKYDAYDRDDLDEVECPHCNGVGTIGLVGDFCKLCKGACVVNEKTFMAYRKK